jgi:hypothetical protein
MRANSMSPRAGVRVAQRHGRLRLLAHPVGRPLPGAGVPFPGRDAVLVPPPILGCDRVHIVYQGKVRP